MDHIIWPSVRDRGLRWHVAELAMTAQRQAIRDKMHNAYSSFVCFIYECIQDAELNAQQLVLLLPRLEYVEIGRKNLQ